MYYTNIIKEIEINYPIYGYKKTSDKLGISIYRIKKIIKENNIKLVKNKDIEIDNIKRITNKEVCYFLGFFWSDGYISRDEITITIKKDDEFDILNVLNKFATWRVTYPNKKLKNKIYKQCCIRLNSKEIKKFLLDNEYGIKSLASPSKIIKLIPDELKYSFFRGLIDGDGCFCSKNRNYFSITGNINQDWTDVENLLINLNINYKLTRKKRKSGNSSFIVISSKSDISILGDYLYPTKYGMKEQYDGIGLKRKYDIYMEIKNKKVSKYSRFK